PGFNQKDVNRQFTKMSWEGREPRAVAMMLRRAFKVAAAAPGGPVYLALPNTVLEAQNVQADIYEPAHFMLSDDIPPDPRKVAVVAGLLLAAKRPALILGDEVARQGAQPEALELAELFGIPVFESMLPAFHKFPRRHPLFRERRFDSRHPRFGEGTDLVLNIGDYDQGDMNVTENADPMPARPTYEKGTRVIRVGLTTAALGRNLPFSEAIVANVKLTLRALIDAVKDRAPERKTYKQTPARLDSRHLGQAPIHPDELGWAL